MVGDIVTASKCGEKSTKLNHEVNTFIDSKKLKLSSKKCANIHIGNKKSRIRETPTLSTDADSRTNTNSKRLRDLSLKNKKIKKMRSCVIYLKKKNK